MATTALKKITTRAKAIRRRSPGTSWKTAVKKAGAEYRNGTIGKARKKKARPARKTVRKKQTRHPVRAVTTTVRSVSRRQVGSVKDHLSKAKKALEKEIGEQALRVFKATKSRIKKKAAKKLTQLKAQFRRIAS